MPRRTEFPCRGDDMFSGSNLGERNETEACQTTLAPRYLGGLRTRPIKGFNLLTTYLSLLNCSLLILLNSKRNDLLII